MPLARGLASTQSRETLLAASYHRSHKQHLSKDNPFSPRTKTTMSPNAHHNRAIIYLQKKIAKKTPTLHDHTSRIPSSPQLYIPPLFQHNLMLIFLLLLLRFSWKVSPQKVEQRYIQIRSICLQHDIASAHGTETLRLALEFDEASNAENVRAGKSDGLDTNRLANRTQVVIKLRNNC
jgi:hypothetical protein